MIRGGAPRVVLAADVVLRAIARANPETARGVERTAEAGAAAARQIARAEVRDTGAYERSIRAAPVRQGPEGPESAIQAGGRRAFYAHIIENGSARQRPRAVLRRAAAAVAGRRR